MLNWQIEQARAFSEAAALHARRLAVSLGIELD